MTKETLQKELEMLKEMIENSKNLIEVEELKLKAYEEAERQIEEELKEE